MIVNVSDTVYVPSQVPALLDEMLRAIVDKARAVKNPIECAFFLWVNIAYLQPFADGNKRTSRLASNLPLLLSNCAPLSFLNVEPSDYAMAILGVYEQQDVSLAIPDADRTGFIELLGVELANLEPYNCARYRLPINKTEEWVANGRPM